MPRRLNWRLIKIHRNYTVEEIAIVLGVHKNTARGWINMDGLEIVNDSRRPKLICGPTLRAFLEARQSARKQPLKPGEMYCVACRTPRRPAGGMAEFRAASSATGTLSALCPNCECIMQRHVSQTKLERVAVGLDVVVRDRA